MVESIFKYNFWISDEDYLKIMNQYYEELKGKLLAYLCKNCGLKEMLEIIDIEICKTIDSNGMYKDTDILSGVVSVKNQLGQKALVIFNYREKYTCLESEMLTYLIMEDIKVIVPLGNYEFEFNRGHVYIHNLLKDKWGVYIMGSQKQIISTQYDTIELINEYVNWRDDLYLVSKNGNKGCIGFGINKICSIPIIYEDVQLEFYEKLKCLKVKSDGNFGIYLYLPSTKIKYDVSRDESFTYPYIKKCFISPLFQHIELQFYDEHNVYLKVSLNGKFGIIDAFNKEFVVPIVFDEITYFSYDNNGINCYGLINGENIFYNGVSFMKTMVFEPQIDNEYKRIRKKIENKKGN